LPGTVFILYNANAGLLNGAFDSIHKIISPSTYQCGLCSITHGYFGAKLAWKNFLLELQASDFNVRILYQEDLKNWPLNFVEVPGVYLLQDGVLSLLIGQNQLTKLKTSEEIVEVLTETLKLTNDSEDRNTILHTH